MLEARPAPARQEPEVRLAWQVGREAEALREAAAWMVLPASRALRKAGASAGLRAAAKLRAAPANRLQSHSRDRESRA
jgi:hypothetical protein